MDHLMWAQEHWMANMASVRRTKILRGAQKRYKEEGETETVPLPA